ncbi:hypothetical protein [Streptomyces sp. NPDC048659]|uniref:hypothetical protein n=1 Tax=Streptomyces sp. NPDC048659 TaxID=3155489 RepID=UPI0034236B23
MIVWQDLTNATTVGTDPANPNYPADACGISIEAQGNDAYVKVITKGGQVWQTKGAIMGNTFVWNQPWVQQTTPTPVAARALRFTYKGDLKNSGGIVNR